MKMMQKISELFDVQYGVNLELNACAKVRKGGINFVSRTAKSNGVSARVARIAGLEPIPAGTISVAGGGSVMESFLQPEPYYSGRDLYYLTAKIPLNDKQKLYYCACLRANKYRYSYGRQANRTLKDICVPAPKDLPGWIDAADPECFSNTDAPKSNQPTPELFSANGHWRSFTFESLFDLKKGRRLTKANMTPGDTPFIGAIDGNNGLTALVGQEALHPGNTMTVNYNGNGVAEAFYQPVPYRCSDDVNVLYPRFKLTPALALFLATVIRQEKYRFSYGRKWHVERMKTSTIGLPVDKKGRPDWALMERYIDSLPFSSQL